MLMYVLHMTECAVLLLYYLYTMKFSQQNIAVFLFAEKLHYTQQLGDKQLYKICGINA